MSRIDNFSNYIIKYPLCNNFLQKIIYSSPFSRPDMVTPKELCYTYFVEKFRKEVSHEKIKNSIRFH